MAAALLEPVAQGGEHNKSVFLSYASQDAEAAARINNALRAAGIEVWFDQSQLRGGDVWDQSIRRQIKACALFLPIISIHTYERAEGYLRLEWKLAVDRSHLISAHKAFLVPVVIDDTAEDEEHVPDKFREVQWTHLPAGKTPPEFVTHFSRSRRSERLRRWAHIFSSKSPGYGSFTPATRLLTPRVDPTIHEVCRCANGIRAVRLMVCSTTLDCRSRTLGTRMSFFNTTLLSASKSLPYTSKIKS